jgi:hypothetical protein
MKRRSAVPCPEHWFGRSALIVGLAIVAAIARDMEGDKKNQARIVNAMKPGACMAHSMCSRLISGIFCSCDDGDSRLRVSVLGWEHQVWLQMSKFGHFGLEIRHVG